MKRWLFKLVLFLLLGAIVNVAVAWGCAYTSNYKYHGISEVEREITPRQLQWWVDHAPDGILTIPDLLWDERPRHFGFSETLMEARYYNVMPQSIVVLRRAGWPLLSLEGAQWWYGANDTIKYFVFEAGLPFGGFWEWLLLRPIWPGFAINTIFYSTILWLFTLGPFTVRRMIRSKRGLCIKCGYDLRGTSESGCPECGWGREAEA
ncbi:MAG: hypothetical protein IH984_14800 [Planctomycetes bacterium]|nr:hypothetical protein [Planctomycetota bacterium]